MEGVQSASTMAGTVRTGVRGANPWSKPRQEETAQRAKEALF